MRILYLEDDEKLSSLVEIFLSKKVILDVVNNFEDALNFIESYLYDIILLDRNINGKDVGMNLIKNIRSCLPNSGIIVLSAYGSTEDKVDGLTLGADDYLEKPFNTNELYARILSLHRRGLPQAIEIEGMEFDTINQQLFYEEKEIFLTQKENKLLFYLLSNRNKIVSSEQLLYALYIHPEETTSSTIRVTINNLRKKIPVDLINTIKTRGYIIEVN